MTRTPARVTQADVARERGTIQQAVSILGYEDRTIRAMADRGELPGAAKIGGSWTFNLAKLRALVEFKEREACRSVLRDEGGKAC